MMIYLVRHGEIDTGKSKRYIGQVDLPLTSTGIEQTMKLRDRLAGVKLAGIYCSDLNRSFITAKIIALAHQISPVASVDLREISLGEWEGRSFEEIRRNFPVEFARRGANLAGYVPTGGESFADFSDRIMAAFNRLVAGTDGDLLFVGHAGVNRAIISHLLGMPLNNIFQICQDYACLNILCRDLCRDKERYRLKLLNSTEHLEF
ncbi:probable phosphoglycerate mutase [Desulfotomaculum arcticum]|uniref:Alpha-ribazole phosphatase n=2 Tax=Desulfotruncus TaxID=2867377 RepID=A0A1I2QP79_9FIRM|nr:probable phosphoglycerate mutase [Desulfotomaculum arcticum] [Desulfotruncus arcticus DSM 17038]